MVVRRLSLCAAVAAACALSFSSVNVLFAQSSAAPDRAAGRMVDSLFEPNAPAGLVPNNKAQLPPRRGIQRPTLQAKLVRNKNKQGEPAFALVDRYGGILRFVEPVEKINLEPYVGRIVGVRHDTGDTLLASQLVFPRSGNNTVARAARPANGVQQAAFQEPIPAGEPDDKALLEPIPADEPTPAGEPELIGEGETFNFEEGEQVYMGEGNGPIYQDQGLDFGGCSNCQDGTCSLHAGHGGYRQGGASPPMSRAYARGEYLLWWLEGMDVPPLVTISDAQDGAVLPNFPGDNPSTQIVYGQDPILEDARSGFRIMLGTWIDECNKQAIEFDYLMLGKLEEDFALGGVNGEPYWIGRPFFDLTPDVDQDGELDLSPREAAEQVSSDILDGTVSVYSSSEFQGAGLTLRHNLCRSCCPTVGCGDCVNCGMGVDCGLGVSCGSGIGCGSVVGCGGDSRYVDFLAGFRWYQLDEMLQITEDLEAASEIIPPPGDLPPNGTTFYLVDQFSTENTFLGGELGFDWGVERNRWSLSLLSKIGLGSTRQQVSINGYTDVTEPGGPTERAAGGLLTQDNNQGPAPDNELYVGNIGDYDRNRFSMIPELNLTVGYKLTQRCKLRLGYTIMYWTNVVRPGDQIDRELNSTQIPSDDADSVLYIPSRPMFTFNETNVLIQGLNTGIEYNW